MWQNAYLSIKNPKASRARLRALDPGRKLLALLCWQLSASGPGAPPLDQILDPHLGNLTRSKSKVFAPCTEIKPKADCCFIRYSSSLNIQHLMVIKYLGFFNQSRFFSTRSSFCGFSTLVIQRELCSSGQLHWSIPTE